MKPKTRTSFVSVFLPCVLGVLAFALLGALAHAAPGEEAAAPARDLVGEWDESLRAWATDRVVTVGARVVAAVVLFVFGWVVAKGIAYAVFAALSRTDVDNRLAERIGLTMLLRKPTEGEADEHQLERVTSKVVYYVLMLLVVVGVLELAGLSQVAHPIQNLVDTVAQALPRIGKALLVLGGAYVVGRILGSFTTTALEHSGVDRRFAELSETPEAAKEQPFSRASGRAVFWLMMVLGLAGAFEALRIDPIAVPLHNAIDYFVGMIPRLGVAVLLVLAGWLGGKIVRIIVRNVLQSVGFDKLAERVGVARLTGSTPPSDVVGIALMVFIVLQLVVAALDTLGLQALSVPMTDMTAQMWGVLPALVVSAAMVAVGVFVGRLLRRVIAGALRNVGFDRLMARLGFEKIADREDHLGEYSELVGFAAYVAVVLLALAQALDNLALGTWAAHLNAFLEYVVKNVAVAILVVGVGFVIGNYVRDLIRARRPGDDTGRWLAEFARYTVLVFAFTMGVRQLDVAEDFVLMTFGLLFGALCLAVALAFGLGSREVAGDIVKRRYDDARARMTSPPRPASDAGASKAQPAKTPDHA
jgi:hypothetical protein